MLVPGSVQISDDDEQAQHLSTSMSFILFYTNHFLHEQLHLTPSKLSPDGATIPRNQVLLPQNEPSSTKLYQLPPCKLKCTGSNPVRNVFEEGAPNANSQHLSVGSL